VYLEAINSWDVSIVALCGDEGGVDLEYDVVEGGAEISTINGGMARGFWIVDIFTSSTVEFHCLNVRIVGLSHGQ